MNLVIKLSKVVGYTYKFSSISTKLYSLKCTNLATKYGEYLGAKDGFTLMLGGYLVWSFRLLLV